MKFQSDISNLRTHTPTRRNQCPPLFQSWVIKINDFGPDHSGVSVNSDSTITKNRDWEENLLHQKALQRTDSDSDSMLVLQCMKN